MLMRHLLLMESRVTYGLHCGDEIPKNLALYPSPSCLSFRGVVLYTGSGGKILEIDDDGSTTYHAPVHDFQGKEIVNLLRC